MNTTARSLPLSSTAAAPAASSLSPLVLILALALRLRACFAEVRQSATLLVQWSREQLQWQNRKAAEVRAIDDPLEAVLPELEECLRNDPPAKRRRILAAYQKVHYATEKHAAELHPACPAHLLQD